MRLRGLVALVRLVVVVSTLDFADDVASSRAVVLSILVVPIINSVLRAWFHKADLLIL